MVLRLRRFLSGLAVFLLVVVMLLWWGSSLVVSLNAPKIATMLEEELGPGFQVGSISGDLVRGLEITGCTIAPDPELSADTAPVIRAAKCNLKPDWWAFLDGAGGIRHIQFSDVQLDLRRNDAGQILWPAFIVRATTAQGATIKNAAFTWGFARAEVTYHFPRAGSTPLRIDIPSADGRYEPGAVFQIIGCNGSIASSDWYLSGTFALNGTRELNGLWRLKDAGVWTLAQALTGGGDASTPGLDSAAIPTGLVSGTLSIGGTMKDPQVSGHVDWNDGAIRHFKVEHGALDLAWRRGLLTLKDSTLKAYTGRIGTHGTIDFRDFPPTYEFEAESAGLDLGSFLNDAGFGKVQLSGIFEGTFMGQGELTSIDSFAGSGQFAAANGEVLNPLYDPQLSGIPKILKYKTLTTDLAVARKTANLTTTQLNSPDLTLDGQGSVTFDGDLDLTAHLRAPARLFRDHPVYGPAVRYLDAGAQQVDIHVAVGGTLKAPDARAEVDQKQLQKQAGQSLLDKLKGIFGNKIEDES